MNVIFKTTDGFLSALQHDLDRLHSFASERVGFISVRAATAHRNLILFPETYYPVADSDYMDDRTVGAMMSQEAIRKALEIALLQRVGIIHVHKHDHRGTPAFSPIDLREQIKYIPDFFTVRPDMPHGAIVLSRNGAFGRVWMSPKRIIEISEFYVIGSKVKVWSKTMNQHGNWSTR